VVLESINLLVDICSIARQQLAIIIIKMAAAKSQKFQKVMVQPIVSEKKSFKCRALPNAKEK